MIESLPGAERYGVRSVEALDDMIREVEDRRNEEKWKK